ncbi:MAG TPA: glycosyltransferase [bacterium]|nr:glycosyltransferase [bacterium]
MRIAHLICKFPPYRGGMGNVAFEQVKRLAELGHEVTVFTLNNNQHDTTPPSSRETQRVDSATSPFKLATGNFELGGEKYTVEYLQAFPRFGNGGFCPGLLKKLKDFNVIQLHYPFFGAQEVLWLGKKLGLIKAKIIIFYHMDASFDNIFLKILSWPSLLIKKSLFKMADCVCTSSLDYVAHSAIKNIYQKYQTRFMEIPFGVSHSPEDVNRSRLEEIKKQISWHGEDKYILFVGNLDRAHYFKGVDILLESFKKLICTLHITHYTLLIVGDGDLRSTYEKQVEDFKISDHVYFTGRVSDEDLACYYYLSDTVVLPSTTKAEAFGLVLVDAESFGKPVIGSDLPGVRSVVGEAGLLVKPGDIDDLAEKFKIILSDENLRQKFSVAGMSQVKEKYNWDKHINNLSGIYGS